MSIEPSAKGSEREDHRMSSHQQRRDHRRRRFIKAPHDAREPIALVATLRSTGQRVGIAYDIGHLSERFIKSFASCDMLLLESNHDAQLLREGPYPWSVKQRVAGPNGHLSNAECALMARECVHRGLRHVVLCHLSQVNNRPEIALRPARVPLWCGIPGNAQPPRSTARYR
jgi:phosphoribosyl 1,2-cyclic phosphodiesterase